MRHTPFVTICLLAMLLPISASCTGPKLHIQNPDEHEFFLDGRRVTRKTVDYRYYGKTGWDSLPQVRQQNGVPQFDRIGHRETVAVPPPASAWLFPLDLPLEVLHRVWYGRVDQTITVVAPEKPQEQRIAQQISGEQLSQLSARGLAARIQR